MPYRCKICKDCSDVEGFYQSDRDYPSEISDSDAEYFRRWRGRYKTYRHSRGSGRTGTRSRSEREKRTGNRLKEGNGNNDRKYRRHYEGDEGRNAGNVSEGENYRKDGKREQSKEFDRRNDIDAREIYEQRAGADNFLSDNDKDKKTNPKNYNQRNINLNNDSDSDNSTTEGNENNKNTSKTEMNLAKHKNSDGSSCDSSSDSSVKVSNHKKDKTKDNVNSSSKEGNSGDTKYQDSEKDWLEANKKKEGDGNREENKHEAESESSYTTDSDSFWDCSSASGSETDTGSESDERSDEENDIKTSDRVKRAVSYRPKKDQGKSRRKRYVKNVSFVKMPSGKKYPIITPKPKDFTCGTVTKKITLHKNGKTSKKEYKIVEKEMQNSIVNHVNCENAGGCFKKYDIVKIEKLINGCLWKRYRHFQQQIIDENGFANQRMLFHGSKNVDDIVNTGFDERYSNFNGMFGAGLYFAKHSSKANQYAYGYMGGTGCPLHSDKNCHICERKILICRVTLGRSKNYYTAQELAHPPAQRNSVVGVPSKKKGGLKYPEYIVYRGEQIYPEYLITYKIQD